MGGIVPVMPLEPIETENRQPAGIEVTREAGMVPLKPSSARMVVKVVGVVTEA